MNGYLILIGTVIAICVLLNRFAQRLPIPSLLIFIALGMCFGVNGIVGIPFDDYQISEQICSVCLLFVMFYGGFGTNLKAARPAAAKASFCRLLVWWRLPGWWEFLPILL